MIHHLLGVAVIVARRDFLAPDPRVQRVIAPFNFSISQPEIAEAITHLAFYVGWPNVFSAMPVAKDVFEKRAR
jgi:4-carboxymuconolactone decarboxylase